MDISRLYRQRRRLLKRIFGVSARIAIVTIIAVSASGCLSVGPKPLFRAGSCFGSLTKVSYHDLSDIGKHRLLEHNGMIGTCRGGFIDLGHVRNGADLTKWVAKRLEKKILAGETEHSFKLTDPSRHYLKIKYPAGFNDLPLEERQAIARDISIQASAYAIYWSTTWHEMITYLGWKPVGINVLISALSPEDNYSNLLGAIIGAGAMRDEELSYNAAVTKIMNDEFTMLGIRPKDEVKEAAKNIYGVWYVGEGYFGSKMLKRDLDIGLEDNKQTPWLIPGLCEDAEPYSYTIPTLDFERYGFLIEYSIDPAMRKKTTSILGCEFERLVPHTHFPKIMAHIVEQEAKITAERKLEEESTPR
jgi:hypothetical protein